MADTILITGSSSGIWPGDSTVVPVPRLERHRVDAIPGTRNGTDPPGEQMKACARSGPWIDPFRRA